MKPKFKLVDDAVGTGLQGYVVTSYAYLKSILGEHNSNGDECKVSTEWCLQFEDGTKASVYDWKMTNLYDESCLSPAELRTLPEIEWHVGGEVARAAVLMGELLGKTVRGRYEPEPYVFKG